MQKVNNELTSWTLRRSPHLYDLSSLSETFPNLVELRCPVTKELLDEHFFTNLTRLTLTIYTDFVATNFEGSNEEESDYAMVHHLCAEN